MLLAILQKTFADVWEQIGQAYTNVWLRTIGFLPELGSALFVIVFTWLTARFVRSTIRQAMAKTSADQNIQSLVIKIGGIFTWLIGLTVMISVLKVDAAGIFAALGLTGAALGFAVRDIIANFISGIVLLSSRPFKIGDSVTIETYEGVVEDLAIRATILRTVDGKEVTIPNAKVFNAVVTKHTPQSSRRIVIPLGINADSSFEQVKDLILSTISSIEGVASEPPIVANITNFSGTVINLEVWFWVAPEASILATSNQVKLAIKEAFERENIKLTPSPTIAILQENKKTTT
ncbi:MAG: small-conductance mechanosensitive channel [bacterium]|nr:MAG: small-conductance mechanosensitive channel [bacterium]